MVNSLLRIAHISEWDCPNREFLIGVVSRRIIMWTICATHSRLTSERIKAERDEPVVAAWDLPAALRPHDVQHVDAQGTALGAPISSGLPTSNLFGYGKAQRPGVDNLQILDSIGITAQAFSTKGNAGFLYNKELMNQIGIRLNKLKEKYAMTSVIADSKFDRSKSYSVSFYPKSCQFWQALTLYEYEVVERRV